MKKYIGYIPAALFTGFYLFMGLTGVGLTMSMIMIWLACFWISALLLHKGVFWGGVFGLIPGIHMIYMGTQYTGQIINIEIPLGITLVLFYVFIGVYFWKKRKVDATKVENKEILAVLIKLVLSAGTIFVSGCVGVLAGLILTSEGINQIIVSIAMIVVPSLLFPLIWLKKRKKFIIIWLIFAVIYLIALGVNYGMVQYDKSITINTSPNINVREYLPFEAESKIVKYDSKTLKLTDNLPRIDGAAALFPVYSAFVNAVYPDTTKLHDGIFEYNNTTDGYQQLAEKKTDIFIGVYPSEEQIAYAEASGTTYKYTPIGIEAFVFFVHKDNPIENLTTDQIRRIYSGEITNWKQVGGKNEEIAAFQRNKGSGSQSMLERFMGDKPIMEAPKELVNDLMVGIIERVSNYKSKTNSIGFSFRYYVEGIIKNPDIKMVSVDGIAPTAENIKNVSYPIVTPIYAITYQEQTNENVDKLLNWILSDEGQYIIEETGYVGTLGNGHTLHKADGYTLFYPLKYFVYEKSYSDERLEEKWVHSTKRDVEFKVITYKNLDRITARDSFLKDNADYTFEDLNHSEPCGINSDGEQLWFRVADANDYVYIVSWKCPESAEDKIKTELWRMYETFTITI